MKTHRPKPCLLLASLCLCLIWLHGGPAAAQVSDALRVSPSDRIEEATAVAIARNAYVYGYSLITSEVTRVQMTNVPAIESTKGPMGEVINVKRYPPADYRGVTAPNADTLYSLAWMDVGAEPWVFSHPDMGKRFFLFPFYSLWMTVIDSPGTRTGEQGAASYALTGPGWKGTLPPGVKEIKSPSRYLLLIGRTYSTGTPEDYAQVNALQDQYKLVPLSSYGKPYAPPAPPPVNPDPGFSMTDKVRDVINAMDISAYFNMMARLMKDNPPLPQDGPMLADMATIGLVPGQPFEIGKLPQGVQKALQEVPKAGYADIMGHFPHAGRNENGWIFAYPTGLYGTNYLQRALIAAIGWPANLSQDAVYPSTKVDGEGRPLNGADNYVIHFKKGQTPPADGFWSITMYDPEWFFVPNPLNRFTVSMRNNPGFNPDGSLDVYVQNTSPGADKEANWLPAPKGNFLLTMRLYWPSEQRPSIIDGSWTVPPVRRSTQ